MRQLLAHLGRFRPAAGPWIIGITGAVAAGKSTLSDQLAGCISSGPDRLDVRQACTDGFLFPNAELARRSLLDRKGFPETYDTWSMCAALNAVRKGPAVFPGHSHTRYDIDPELASVLDQPQVLIIEGLGFGTPHGRLPVDCLIYLDAEELDLEAWYVARFLGFWRTAQTDPNSFYARFLSLDEAGVTRVARAVWAGVNLPNLRDHIVGLRALADVVVHKGPDHGIDHIDIQRLPARPNL